MIRSKFSQFIKDNTPAARLAASFAREHDLSSVPTGRYELGDQAFVSVQEYETHENSRFEAHQRYIDIQLIESGKESILTVPTCQAEPETPYDDDQDVQFYRGTEGIKPVDLEQDGMVILFPEDAHAPGNSISGSTQVRKIVFKIPVSLWQDVCAGSD